MYRWLQQPTHPGAQPRVGHPAAGSHAYVILHVYPHTYIRTTYRQTDRQTDRRAHTHTHVHTSCIQVPNGQFGTRLRGGADAASPRYIFTLLNSLTRQVLTQTLNPLNPKPQFLLNSLTRRVLTSATTRCLSARSVSLLLACVSLPWPPGCLGCCHLCPLC